MSAPSTVSSPLQGTVVAVKVATGTRVRVGQELVIVESMKMEHVVAADQAGEVTAVHATVGATVGTGEVLLELSPTVLDAGAPDTEAPDTDAPPASEADVIERVRADLADVLERHAIGTDSAVPKRSPNGTAGAIGPRGRTSRTCAIPARSSSTARS